jgi:hypothetical protein
MFSYKKYKNKKRELNLFYLINLIANKKNYVLYKKIQK